MIGRPPRLTRTDTLFPYTTLFRSRDLRRRRRGFGNDAVTGNQRRDNLSGEDRQREVPGRDTAPHAPPVHAQHVAFACRSGEFNGIEVCPRPGRIVTAEIHSFPYLCQSSEERREGKECVRTCRSRWGPY